MSGKTLILSTKTRVGYFGWYIVILPDHAAGRRNRFTVYRIPGSPGRRIQIIGLELPWGHANKIAKEAADAED